MGVRALRAKHKAAWESIVPVNIFLGTELGVRKEGVAGWETQPLLGRDASLRNRRV